MIRILPVLILDIVDLEKISCHYFLCKKLTNLKLNFLKIRDKFAIFKQFILQEKDYLLIDFKIYFNVYRNIFLSI